MTAAQDRQYNELLASVKDSFRQFAGQPLFVTDQNNLFSVYLDGINSVDRQHYNCHECRRFLNRFGSLVSVDDDGNAIPVMWKFEPPKFFQNTLYKMWNNVVDSRIVDTFVPDSRELSFGTQTTGLWSHFSVTTAVPIKQTSVRHNWETVIRAVQEYDKDVLDRALVIIRSDQLYRGEKVLGQAEWLRSLYDMDNRNLVWRAVAKAPDGFCHPRSSMIGTLLDDLKAGLSVDDAKKKFAEKMHPLQYQRPTSLPSDQTIQQAEAIIQKAEAAGSLRRRFMRPDEVEAIWVPSEGKSDTEGKQGVFKALYGVKEQEPAPAASGTPVKMTWDKFRRTVLPDAEKITYTTTGERLSYGMLVTAADMEAPPIIQWDDPEHRNPASWYLKASGSTSVEHGLPYFKRVPVYAISLQPNMWRDEERNVHQGRGVLFLLQGCQELYNTSLALFPEILRSEYHGVRKVIEAYSRRNKLEENPDRVYAGGILLQANAQRGWSSIFEVQSKGQNVKYHLDRWD